MHSVYHSFFFSYNSLCRMADRGHNIMMASDLMRKSKKNRKWNGMLQNVAPDPLRVIPYVTHTKKTFRSSCQKLKLIILEDNDNDITGTFRKKNLKNKTLTMDKQEYAHVQLGWACICELIHFCGCIHILCVCVYIYIYSWGWPSSIISK